MREEEKATATTLKVKLKPNKPKQDGAGIRNPGSEVMFLLAEVNFKLV